MAKPYMLKEVEQAQGAPLDRVIPPLVNAGGQGHAARVLGLSQATVSQWLKRNGYVQVIRYEKVSEVK